MTVPSRPPRLARWLVEHAVPADMREEVSGDLLELFHRDSINGDRRAALRYWRNAVSCLCRFGTERCRPLLGGGGMPTGSAGREGKRTWQVLAGWRMDLTLAGRMLIRHPALSAIALLGITVAIAIATTIVTLVGEQLGASALPLPEGTRIVALQKWDAVKHGNAPVGTQDLVAWRERLLTVQNIGGFRTATMNLILPPAAPEPVAIAEMSAAGFDVAGIAPAMGRTIHADDERPGAAPVLVIGFAEWRRRFRANPAVLGTTVQLGDTHYSVVGVMPEGFAFPLYHDYWIPLGAESSSSSADVGPPISAFGRLAPGASLESAQAELTALGAAAGTASLAAHQDVRPRAVRYAEQFSEMNPGNAMALQLLRFFVALLLVVVSINVSVLVYARTAARGAEIAVRTALGASRGRIVAQLFVEGLVLAGLGALCGVSLAVVVLAHVRETLAQTEPLPFWVRFSVSRQTMAYVAGLTMAAAAVIGALPAWKATSSRVQGRLQALSAGGGGGMQLGRLWTALILMQVAFAVGLLPQVLVRMSELARQGLAEPGFAADEYLVAQLSIEQAGPTQSSSPRPSDRFARRYREMEAIMETRTVRGSTFAWFSPGFEPSARVQSDSGGGDTTVGVNGVSVNFFGTLRMSVLTGRDFTGADAAPGARTVIVNRSLADRISQGGPVLGSRVHLGHDAGGPPALPEWHEVVGIVDDIPAPAAGGGAPDPKVYRAITPEGSQALTMILHLRDGDTEPWGTTLRRIAGGLDPALQVKNVTVMDDLLRQQQRSSRMLAGVLAATTLSVLLLSAAGIYAMMAFAVSERRREIGIRLVLGAGARRVLWTLFSRVAAQLIAGAAAGSAVAVLLDYAANGASMSGQGTVATAAVVLLMAIAGVLAAAGPACQGLRIEPAEALRHSSR